MRSATGGEREYYSVNCHVRPSPTSFSYQVLQRLLLTLLAQLAKIAAHPKELGRSGAGHSGSTAEMTILIRSRKGNYNAA